MQAPAALGTRPWRRLALGPGAAIVLAGGALCTPFPFTFACACTCGSGSAAVAPESPWQPLLLVAGAALATLILRRRGGGGPHGTGGDVAPGRGLARRLRFITLRLAAATAVACAALAGTSFAAAASVAVTPAASSPAAPPCDCALTGSRGHSPPSDVLGVTVAVPGVGAEPRLPLALALAAAGGAVALGAVARVRTGTRAEVRAWTG